MSKVKNNPYIRVGTIFYKKIQSPLISGDFITVLAPWNLATIKQDETHELISTIPKYDTFCLIPSHLDFQPVIGTAYNKYEPFVHIPEPGECTATIDFLKHIFGEQIELGLDYIKLLLERPSQVLPILCLVSEERNTGKTTFLNFLKRIFGGNMTLNTNEDFRSQFNSDWSSKLIIGVDEVLLDKREDSERIKNLSAARNYKTEAKGVDKREGDFFGKFILASNNEETFIKIDPEEIRYWVVKVPRLPVDKIDLLSELTGEIPALLHFLVTRPFKTESKTRMWFTPDHISTAALKKVKENNKSTVEKELREILIDELEKFQLPQISFTNSDLIQLLKDSGVRAGRSQIASLLRQKWGLVPNETPSTYTKYRYEESFGNYEVREFRDKGRYYTFTREILDSL
jgi:hypothetical protein